MVTFAGAILPDLLLGPHGQPVEGWAGPAPWSIYHQVGQAGASTLSDGGPFTPTSRAIPDSAQHRSTFNDYYERVWTLPPSLALGDIVDDVTIRFHIWNAFLYPVEMSSASNDGDAGLSLPSPPVAQTWRALEILPVHLDVRGVGEDSIEGSLTFTFDNQAYSTMQIAGTRAGFWGSPPDWTNSFDVTLEYRTEVITSRSGKEQRIAARQSPRKSLSYRALMRAGAFRAFSGHMNRGQNKTSLVPEFSRSGHLALPASAGDLAIELEESADWLVPGQQIAIHAGDVSFFQADVRKIESVSGNNVTFDGLLSRDWPAGSKVYPTLSGYLPASISARMRTNNAAEVSMSLNVLPGSEFGVDPGLPAVQYDGRELFIRRPNWADAPTVDFQTTREEVDYGFGRIASFTPIDFNTRLNKLTYLGRDRDDADAFVRFFRRQMGQLGEFFMPTWTEDMAMKGSETSGSLTMTVEGTSVAEDFSDMSVRDVIVFLDDGTYIVRRIASVALDGLDSEVTFTQAWGRAVGADEVLSIHWLPLCRFASDSLTISWVTDEVAEFAVNIKSLEYVAQE